jgi:anti-sigma factor RsiW
MKLMAYADGELEGAERSEIEKLIASDETAKKTVAQMRSLGGVVRATRERDAKAIASFDIADAVMAKLPSGNVISLEAQRARRAKVAFGVAALAVAAAIAIFMKGANEEAPMAKGPTAKPAMTAEQVGVEVDAVQSPGVSVSVFQVPDEANLTTSVVVWVDETGDK